MITIGGGLQEQEDNDILTIVCNGKKMETKARDIEGLKIQAEKDLTKKQRTETFIFSS